MKNNNFPIPKRFYAECLFTTLCKSGLYSNPLNTGEKLNAHKTFRRYPKHLLNVSRTFNLHSVFWKSKKLFLDSCIVTVTLCPGEVRSCCWAVVQFQQAHLFVYQMIKVFQRLVHLTFNPPKEDKFIIRNSWGHGV